MARVAAVVLGVLLPAVAWGQAWEQQASGTAERLRGVSAVSAAVAWASGANGTVLRTADGGATWTRRPVPGAEALDFRDIEAFDAQTAYVLSIGAGDRSRIYKTIDGGETWHLQFTNPDPNAFYDAFAFWDRENGIAVGDPVEGRFTVVRTADGGATWARADRAGMPPALPGDGAFAASGTILTAFGSREAWFGSGGGARARVYRSTDRGATWEVSDTPVAAGTPSAGLFSIAFRDARHGVAVGGDYRKERDASDNIALTTDGGASWTRPGATRLRGFRSAVAFLPGSDASLALAVGPAGSDISRDDGRTWSALGDEGFHALSVAGDGAAWAVGEQGAIARLRGR
ncbi:MAG TPA: hypothetical protein VK911_12570 [Vicinamibacterales bacterium]|nr:hypothetical protein [Vicinamibacterales bacterium]